MPHNCCNLLTHLKQFRGLGMKKKKKSQPTTDLQSHFCLFEGLQNNSEMRCRQQNSSATAGQASVIPLRAAVLVRRLLEQMFVCVRIRMTPIHIIHDPERLIYRSLSTRAENGCSPGFRLLVKREKKIRTAPPACFYPLRQQFIVSR